MSDHHSPRRGAAPWTRLIPYSCSLSCLLPNRRRVSPFVPFPSMIYLLPACIDKLCPSVSPRTCGKRRRLARALRSWRAANRFLEVFGFVQDLIRVRVSYHIETADCVAKEPYLMKRPCNSSNVRTRHGVASSHVPPSLSWSPARLISS